MPPKFTPPEGKELLLMVETKAHTKNQKSNKKQRKAVTNTLTWVKYHRKQSHIENNTLNENSKTQYKNEQR